MVFFFIFSIKLQFLVASHPTASQVRSCLGFFFSFTFPVRYISSWRSHGKNRWFWSSNSEVTMEWIPPVWTVVWIYSMDGRWREHFPNCSPKLHNPFCKERNISNIFRMETNTWLCWGEAFLMCSRIITPGGMVGNLLLSIQYFFSTHWTSESKVVLCFFPSYQSL